MLLRSISIYAQSCYCLSEMQWPEKEQWGWGVCWSFFKVGGIQEEVLFLFCSWWASWDSARQTAAALPSQEKQNSPCSIRSPQPASSAWSKQEGMESKLFKLAARYFCQREGKVPPWVPAVDPVPASRASMFSFCFVLAPRWLIKGGRGRFLIPEVRLLRCFSLFVLSLHPRLSVEGAILG